MRKKSRRLFVPAYSSFHRFVFQLSFFCLFGRLVSCPSVCETFFSFQTPLSSITRQQLNDTAVTTAYKTRQRREVDEKSAVGKREVTDSKGNPTTQLVSGDFFFFFFSPLTGAKEFCVALNFCGSFFFNGLFICSAVGNFLCQFLSTTLSSENEFVLAKISSRETIHATYPLQKIIRSRGN